MKVCLMTFNAKFIHKALSLRWLYVARDQSMDCEIVEYTIKDDLDNCVQDMLGHNPDVIGCSTYIWNAEIMKEFILKIHSLNPKIRIIVGGPEVSYEAEEWLDYPIQCVLKGEGEKTFWQAVRQEENIDGYYSKEYQSKINYSRTDLAWLETLESPYFLEIDKKEMAHRYFYFETSRGCPYQCSYCLSSLDNQVRFFSQEYLFRQLDRLNETQVKQVKLLDRTFNASEKLSFDFVYKIESLKNQTSFQFEIVVDKLSERMLNFLLTEATVEKYRFEVGIQSFNPKTLAAVGRRQDLKRAKEVIELLTKKGYALHVDLIGGLPYEDLASFESSFNELFSSQAKEIQVGLLKLLKGTRLKKEANQYDIKYESCSPYTVTETAWLSNEEVIAIEDVYHATEKIINSQRAYTAFHTLMEEKMINNPFQVLKECGARLKEIQHLQVIDYYECLYDSILHLYPSICVPKLQAILLNDYCLQFRQKSKKLFGYNLDESLRTKLYQVCLEKGILNQQEFYNYTDCNLGWHNHEIALQLLIYSKNQTYPSRIWFTQEGEIL